MNTQIIIIGQQPKKKKKLNPISLVLLLNADNNIVTTEYEASQFNYVELIA